jgi:hypothetical protein
VPNGKVDKVDRGLTRVDHETIGEFHGFRAGGTKFARDDYFATLGARFHDETEDTIASTVRGGLNEIMDRESIDQRTDGRQDHPKACISNSRTGRQQKVHGIELSQHKARENFQGT